MASESKSICPQTVKSYIPICYSVSVPVLSPVGSCTLRSLYLTGILFLLFFPCVVSAQALIPMRRWTSNEGKVIEAELVGFKAAQAELRMPNGQRVLVADERFSTTDQAELVRARLVNEYWSTTVEATRADYFHSIQTPEHRKNDLICGYVAFGRDIFHFGVMLPSKTLNLRSYDRITFDDGEGATYVHDYKPESVQRWGEPPRETTRVSVMVNHTYGMSLIPILLKGLTSGRLSITASHGGLDPALIKVEPEEQKALFDIIAIFMKAQMLVKSGVMKSEPLADQVFQAGAGATVVVAPQAPEEDEELQRLRASRGGGRFGKITWTPTATGVAVMVDGLGWIRTDVVVRTSAGDVRRVPFAEIDPDSQKKILKQRLGDFAGAKPTPRGDYDLYYSKEVEERLHAYVQGLIFAQEKSTGVPFLYAQGNSTRLRGAPVTQLVLKGDALVASLVVPVELKDTKMHTSGKTVWSVAGTWLNKTQRDLAAELAKSRAIQLEINSAKDESHLTMEDEHLRSTLEAICCYQWALIVQ